MPKHYGSSRYEGSNTPAKQTKSAMAVPITGAMSYTHSGVAAGDRGKANVGGYGEGRGPITGKVDKGMDGSNMRAGKRYQEKRSMYY